MGSDQDQPLLKKFLDRNPVLSFIKDEQGVYIYANQSFLNFFAVDEVMVLGKTDFDWLPPKTAKQFSNNDEYVRCSEEPLETIEETLHPQGVIYCLVHKFSLKSESGKSYVGGIASDITYRVEMERALKTAMQELSAARDQALEVAALKSAFVSNISHELRTPLTSILASIELLMKNTTLNEEAKTLMQIAEESAESLLALVNNILDLSKIEAGKMEVEAETFNLPDLVQECVKAMSIEVSKKNLKLAVEIDQRIPLVLQGDRLRIRQLLLNLVGNGIKFTDMGRITVEMRLASTDSDIIHVRFDVRDTGIGISKQEQKLLFKPFSQIDSSNTRQHNGTGLGLYISKQLVEIMGGTMSIESSKGEGTLCSFTLPFKLPKEECLSTTSTVASPSFRL